ncbi:XdhC family protein, partial [Tabrizicola sp.]|uniref:XdhC family protein n=1 Tax=Tabrizicola sp. TaxID=2005166 RepID=UPI003F379C7C
MFDLAALAEALRDHGRVARVVIAGVEGSSPREVGASMLVWREGQSGTIGGGALEYAAAAKAREWLAAWPPSPTLPPVGERGSV